MADVKWIKVSTDMFESNRKIKQIEMMPEGDTILVIWFKLLLLAGNVNDGGAIYITPEIPYNDEELAYELRKHPKTVKAALSVFERYGMIEIVDGVLILSSWEKYQNIEGMERIREQTRARVAKSRERKRLEACNVTCNATVTHGNAIEEDKEKDKEKESHSIIHSSREEAKLKYLGGTLGKGVVMLSDEQFDLLMDNLSIEEFEKYVGIVADMELSGKHYKKKTHYQAIMDMVAKDRRTKA